MLLQFFAGTPYLFGAYAGDLRSLFAISQSKVQLLGTLLNIGTWLGFTGGFLLDRIGRVYTLLVGALFMYVGYFFMYLAASGIGMGPDARFFPLWCIMFFLAGQGVSYYSMVSLKVTIRSFAPEQRGQIVGILQAFFGISGGMLSIVRSAFFHTDVASLLLFLAMFCSLGGLLFGLIVNATSGLDWAELVVHQHFAKRAPVLYALCIGGAVYVLVVALFKPLMSHGAVVGLAVAGLALLFSVVLLPIGTGPWVVRRQPDPAVIISVEKETAEDALLPREPDAPDFTLGQLLRSGDFFLLFFVFMCAVGPSIAVVNNMFSLVLSRSFVPVPLNGTFVQVVYPETSLPNLSLITTFVAVFSSVNTLGRLGFGFVSDRLNHRVDRRFWLVVSVCVLLMCNIFFSFSSLNGFYPLIIFTGLAYGGLFAVVPSVVADAYGQRNFGLFYGIIVAAPACGSLLFSTLTAGSLADRYAADAFIEIQGSDGDLTQQCIGANCFLFTFITFICVQAVALVAALYLWLRRRSVAPAV